MTLPLERHWKNVGWALGVETFWGISLALISVVAILPVFLSHLGASNTVLGALPAIWTLMGVIGGWVANRIRAAPLPFPQNYAIGFFIAGVCMTLGAFFFLPVVEDPGATAPQGQAVRTVIHHIREVLADRGGVRVYLALMVLTVGGWILVSYYAVYAEKRFGLRAQDSAIFTAVCMGGQMLGSLVTGVVGDRFGYAKVAAVSALSLTAGLPRARRAGLPPPPHPYDL